MTKRKWSILTKVWHLHLKMTQFISKQLLKMVFIWKEKGDEDWPRISLYMLESRQTQDSRIALSKRSLIPLSTIESHGKPKADSISKGEPATARPNTRNRNSMGWNQKARRASQRPTVSYYSVTSAPGSYYGENKLPGSYNEIIPPIANDRETEAPESYNRETRAPLNSESRGTYQSRTPQSYYGKTREPNSYYAEMRATGSYYGEAREPGSYNRETRAPESYYGETKVPETYYSDTRTMRPYYSETRTPGYYYTRQETRPDPHPQSKKPSWLYSDSDQKVENNGYIDTWYQSYGNVNNQDSYPQPWIKHVAIWYKTTW